jgi:ATP/ADP translocase
MNRISLIVVVVLCASIALVASVLEGIILIPSKWLRSPLFALAEQWCSMCVTPGLASAANHLPTRLLQGQMTTLWPTSRSVKQLQCAPAGYGLLLAGGTVDELIYNEIGNEVLLVKYIDSASGPQ